MKLGNHVGFSSSPCISLIRVAETLRTYQNIMIVNYLHTEVLIVDIACNATGNQVLAALLGEKQALVAGRSGTPV